MLFEDLHFQLVSRKKLMGVIKNILLKYNVREQEEASVSIVNLRIQKQQLS